MSNPINKWKTKNSKNSIPSILDPNIPLVTLIKDPLFFQAFQIQNQDIVQRVISDEGVKNIYELIKTTNERSILNKITALFFLPNSPLLKTTATNPNVSAYICDILHLPFQEAYKRIGLITQIITYSINSWPQEVLNSFSQSTTLYPTLLLSLHITSIYYSMLQYCVIPHRTSHIYLWGFFRAVVGPSFKIAANPTGWYDVPGVTACFQPEIINQLTSLHRSRVFRVLATFLKGFNDNEFPLIISTALPHLHQQALDFCQLQIDQNPSKKDIYNKECTEERASIFVMGLASRANTEMTNIAIKILQNEPLNTELAEYSIKYLTAFFDGNQLEPIVNLLFRILNPTKVETQQDSPPPTHFLAQAAISLVQELIERVDAPRFFAKLIQLSIASSWNSKERENLKQRAFCLATADIVGNLSSWPGWEDFQNVIVSPFSQQEKFDRSYNINTEGWDQDDIEKLRKQESSIPMKECDHRRFVMVEFKDDSDSRSALSGSYIEEESVDEETFFQSLQPKVLDTIEGNDLISQNHSGDQQPNPEQENEKKDYETKRKISHNQEKSSKDQSQNFTENDKNCLLL